MVPFILEDCKKSYSPCVQRLNSQQNHQERVWAAWRSLVFARRVQTWTVDLKVKYGGVVMLSPPPPASTLFLSFWKHDFEVEPRLALNSCYSCLHLLSAEKAVMHHCAQLSIRASDWLSLPQPHFCIFLYRWVLDRYF